MLGNVWKFVEMLFLRWQPVHSLLFTKCQHGFTFLTRVKKCSKILRKTLSFVKLVKFFELGNRDNLDVDFGFQRTSFPENTDVVLFNLIHPIIHYHRVFQIFLSIKRASHLLLAKQKLLIIIPMITHDYHPCIHRFYFLRTALSFRNMLTWRASVEAKNVKFIKTEKFPPGTLEIFSFRAVLLTQDETEFWA